MQTYLPEHGEKWVISLALLRCSFRACTERPYNGCVLHFERAVLRVAPVLCPALSHFLQPGAAARACMRPVLSH